MDTPTPTTKNVALLRTVMELVTANPDWHDQDFWGLSIPGCGTTRCIAGWANALSGYEEVWSPLRLREGDGVWGVRLIDGGTVIPSSIAATLALGLTDDEAGELFYADDIDTVWDIVEVITDGEILRADVEASMASSSRAVVTDVADLVSA